MIQRRRNTANVLKKLKKFLQKDYRDGYMQTQVRAGIAYQMQALRSKFRVSQKEMAARTGKTQSVISRLEDEEYGRVTVQTLLDVASSLDVALLVQFVDYPDFLRRTSDMSDDALQPETIQESLSKYQVLTLSGHFENFNVVPLHAFTSVPTASFAPAKPAFVIPGTSTSPAPHIKMTRVH